MKKLVLIIVLLFTLRSAKAQAIQGTIRHGSHKKEVYLTIKNNSAQNIKGNITKLLFTVYFAVQHTYSKDALGFTEISTLPKPGTGVFSSRSFMSFLNNYLTTSWTGNLPIDLDPGEEMDIAAFVMFAYTPSDPEELVEDATLVLYYANPMYSYDRDWLVEVDGLNMTDGNNRFYSQGLPTIAVNDEWGDGASVNLTTFSIANLPVTLKNFNAKEEGSLVNLNWATTEETNSDYFDIEHSRNAKEWLSIGKVASNGESKTLKDYQFQHKQPVSGLNYYRLKMVDKDQTFAYSKMNSVQFKEDDNGLFPNPVDQVVFFKNADLENLSHIQILNNSGKVVYETAKIGEAGVNIAHLPAGSFVVKLLKMNGESYSRKLIKK